MVYVWVICLIVLNGAWWMLNFFALPGNWLVVISTCLFAWWKWEDGVFGIGVLGFIVLLAVLGEVIEFFAGMGGAKKAGASRLGALGALGGAIFGALVGTFFIPIPLLGTLVGACIGAGGGAWGVELSRGRQMDHAVKTGVGAGVGVLMGTGSKIVLGGIICLIVAIAGFV